MKENRINGILSTLTTVAEATVRADRSISDERLTIAARRAVQQAAFLQACEARGHLAVPKMLDMAPSAVQIPIEPLRKLDACPDLLGPIHEILLATRVIQTEDGRIRTGNVRQGKKSGGVFYTPDFIVRYMVDRIPPRARSILDPACGCGVFLLEAARRCLREGQSPEAIAESLFGMDVDPEAVVIARQSLWLELAPPDEPDVARTLADIVTRNIRHGDALLDDGAFPSCSMDVVLGNPPYRRETNTKGLLDRIAQTELGRRYRTPRMDLWYYFVHRGLELLKPGGRLSFIVSSYWTQAAGAEKLVAALRESTHVEEIFLLDKLSVFPGVAGQHMILSVRVPLSGSREGEAPAEPCATSLPSCSLTELPLETRSLGPSVQQELRPPGSLERLQTNEHCDFTTTIKRPHGNGSAESYVTGEAPLIVFHKTADQLFRNGRINLEPHDDELESLLAPWPRLDTLGIVRQGIAENPANVTERTSQAHGEPWRVGEGVFALTPGELANLAIPPEQCGPIRPYHDLCDLGRYRLADEPSLALIYSTAATWGELGQFPALAEHLARFQPIMEARRETLRGIRRWWQIHWPRDESLWRRTKVIALQMAKRPSFVAAERPVYVPFSANVFVPDESTRESVHYFAALLNSRLLWRWYRLHAKRRGVGLELNGHVLAATPIRPIDFSVAADVARHDRLVELAQRMTHMPEDEMDREIDEIVESLYNKSQPEA